MTVKRFSLYPNHRKRNRNWLLTVTNGVRVWTHEVNVPCSDPNTAKAEARAILTKRGIPGIRWRVLENGNFTAEIHEPEKPKSPGQKKVSRKGGRRS